MQEHKWKLHMLLQHWLHTCCKQLYVQWLVSNLCCAKATVVKSLLQYLDINECALGTSGCTQLCSNTVGNYACSCNTGYTLATDNQTCNGEYKNGSDFLDMSLFLT